LAITKVYSYKKYYFILETIIKYTKVKVLKITETQDKTLKKMKSYKVNVSQFIRDAIKEKIDRDFLHLRPKIKINYCPFSNNTIKINNLNIREKWQK
jgi:adenine-specific DNA methylase